MLEDITIIDGDPVKAVKWAGDAHAYDLSLYALGHGLESFLVLNPWIDNSSYHYISDIPKTEQCITWYYNDQWIAKHFNQNWTPLMGYTKIELTAPRLEWSRNSNLDAKIKFKNNPALTFSLAPWDIQYQLTWYLDEEYNPTDDKVWAIAVKPAGRSVTGVKDMGYVTPLISKKIDVIFISYNEVNAEDNWQRVLEKAPYAKRVNGVEGIFEAHKAAARLATTDMFYVVDGDAYLVDEWQFDFEPSIFDRDCAYVWNSRNPINDLIYENGGVKLFPKSVLLKTRRWETLDMFNGIVQKVKPQSQISNITKFNTDEFSTWRSAFRECVKLYTVNQMSKLNTWSTVGADRPFGQYAATGADAGYRYARDNAGDQTALIKINDYTWLREQFKNEKYNEK